MDWTRRKDEERQLLGARDASLGAKMRAAARLKAEFAKTQADCTETDWTGGGHASGPFRFHFDYQRADLVIEGPDPYDGLLSDAASAHVIYTGGGMAAMATALVALDAHEHTFRLPQGCYAETRELAGMLSGRRSRPSGRRSEAVLLDSAAPTLETVDLQEVDICVIDTSCYAPTSGTLRRIVRHAQAAERPRLILVRSHHKLDMLGTEYGRLGSVVLLSKPGARVDSLRESLEDAARLIGAAARPEDFAPFAAGPAFHAVTRGRVAQIILNTRYLQGALTAAGISHVRFQHGLYVDVELAAPQTRELVSALAQKMADALDTRELRHAGSFGFDFTAVEWTDHPTRDALALRIAPGDHSLRAFKSLAGRIVAFLSSRVRSRAVTIASPSGRGGARRNKPE